MRRIFSTIRYLLLLSVLFCGIGISINTDQADAVERLNLYQYLYQEETQTLILKDRTADATEEIANGYKSVTYEYAKTEATIHHAIIGEGVTFFHDAIDLFGDIETLVLGDSLTGSINYLTDYCNKLKSITIEDGMNTLPEYFLSPKTSTNSTLETVILGKSVQTIGDYSFYHCVALKNIVVNPENPYLKVTEKGLYSKDNKKLYAYPTAAEGEPVIAPGTEEISPAVFAYSHMTSIEIPASVTSLSASLFEHCEQLEKFTFAENSQCIQTESSSLPQDGDNPIRKGIFTSCTHLQEVRFGENFQKLAADTFYGSAVRIVYFGKSFQSSKIFSEDENEVCDFFPNIEKLEISKQNPHFKIKNAALLSKDGKKLYYYPIARKNKSYTIPTSVKIIAEYAFCGNKYLQTVHTGKNTKKIGAGAFSYCKKLKKVTLGKNIKKLYNATFSGCKKLTTIVNLEKITWAMRYALDDTKIVYIPDWESHMYPAAVRGKVMYFYTLAGSKKTEWSIIKGKNCVKILKRYKNSNRIKVKFKRKGHVVIQAKQGKEKTKYDFKIQ